MMRGKPPSGLPRIRFRVDRQGSEEKNAHESEKKKEIRRPKTKKKEHLGLVPSLLAKSAGVPNPYPKSTPATLLKSPVLLMFLIKK